LNPLILFKERVMQEYLELEEIPLAGGRMTAGVMRVGDTVRRPLGGLTDLSVNLLRHFEQVGFTGAPRYLGRDQAERDILTYIPGWVPTKFQYFRDEQKHKDLNDWGRNGLTPEHLWTCIQNAELREPKPKEKPADKDEADTNWSETLEKAVLCGPQLGQVVLPPRGENHKGLV
jgi:hypothetical protein